MVPRQIPLSCILLFLTPLAAATVIAPDDAAVQDPGWEADYQTRLTAVRDGQTWDIANGNQSEDAGKWTWSPLLAEMAKDVDDPVAFDDWITGTGAGLVGSSGAGTFYKAFSCPGLTFYYFLLDERGQLPQSQRDAIHQMITTVNHSDSNPTWGDETGWDQMMRPDHFMDPVWDQTEFNSENFNWMARTAGLLWADELAANDKRAFFQTHLDNLVRALYCAGRVEWNSSNYWGHTVNPLLVLYEFAPDDATRAKARALLDWMVIESALHYCNGHPVGPDTRAKAGCWRPFHGSAWGHAWCYFSDPERPFDFTTDEVVAEFHRSEIGYLAWSSYRPPRAALDIASRRFDLPVELHLAHPHYQLDFNNYAAWRGDQPASRRTDFETLYIDERYQLASLASDRPNGLAVLPIGGRAGSEQKMFSERNLWRLAVADGDDGLPGPLQVFGNAGPAGGWGSGYDVSVCRQPWEQMAQDRGVLLRVIKKLERMWVALPSTVTVEWTADHRLTADLGGGVYLGIVPHQALGHSSQDFPRKYDGVHTHTQYLWQFDAAALGGLVMEVGTADDFASYSAFKDAFTGQSLGASGDRLDYTSLAGHQLAIEHTGVDPAGWTLVDGTVVTPAGKRPRFWRETTEEDYDSWPAIGVASGTSFIRQDWGSGRLDIDTANEALSIVVDLGDAAVSYLDRSGANSAPVIDSPASAVPTEVTGTTTQLSVSASDPDGDSLSYDWQLTAQPTGSAPSFDRTTREPLISFDQNGNYTFSVTVSDGHATVTGGKVTVTVNQTATTLDIVTE